MNRTLFRSTLNVLWYATIIAAAVAGGPARAHEGESHDEPVMVPAPNSASVRRSFSGTGEALELTVVYDARNGITGSPVPLRLLLADKFTNKPQDGAHLELTLSGGEVDTNLTVSPTTVPGEYAAAATLSRGMAYALLVDVTLDGLNDFFSIDGIAFPVETEAGHMEDEGASEKTAQVALLWIGGVAGAAFVGFWAGRATRGELKEGAK